MVGKFAVLKDDKLIEGGVSVSDDKVIVRQGRARPSVPQEPGTVRRG